MSNAPAKLLPHPALTLCLIAVWMVVNNTLGLGHLLLGTVLAVLIPLLTRRFWPEAPKVARWGLLLRYLTVLLTDIVVANFWVASLVLRPGGGLRPGFVWFPVALTDPFAITVLASTISLTPGTVSVDLSEDARHLLIHSIDLDDAQALVDQIKQRYEGPLQEIFQC
jgi:multicomponent K+:H+ antiporter subunit E